MNSKSDGLPQNWLHTKLNNILYVISGEAFKQKDYSKSGIKLLQIANVSFGKIIWENQKFLPQDLASDYPELHLNSGDIVMALNRPILNNKLKIATLMKMDTPAILYQRVACFKFYDKELIPYCFSFTQSQLFLKQVQKNLKGTDQPYINTSNLPNLSIPLPPLNEQKRIVTKIEALQTRSSAVKEELEAIKPLLNQFRQSILASAFRGDLTKDWREQNPDVEPAEVLLERIRVERNLLYKKECDKAKAEGKRKPKPFKQNVAEINYSLPTIPDTWKWDRFVNIANILGGVTKGRKFKDKKTIMLPYLRVANVQDGYLDLSEIKEIQVLPEDTQKYHLEYGDILVTEGGDRDKLGRGTIWQNEIENCIHQNHVYRARLYHSDLSFHYISLVLKSDIARKYFFNNASQTTNLASINITMLGNVPLAIPPKDEQKEIVRRIESLFKLADNIEQQYQQAGVELETLNQSILAKAFRGELVPQDPNDEPASVLLERIKEERDKAKTTAKKSKTRKKRSSKKKSSKKKDEQLGIPGM